MASFVPVSARCVRASLGYLVVLFMFRWRWTVLGESIHIDNVNQGSVVTASGHSLQTFEITMYNYSCVESIP